ncbi:hypothetical protein PRUB_a1940 [Pseudoalteromonas rubra]|uniref:Uncharacterized protein n=1 Tax=Pseudoalteromonas rubra TaxID=43658 RepID=A0A8T0CGJ1_9GAMM|nr:hypothetical protein PRUB_a1936 [Pseudoalteromonas rubra]KAF7788851.1 hypothetical protein PRUB_a1937 [Pseudoalteromonas rubra]KAF7788852.1 hypothetical protein PRUB_a1938 [Pseudoalteromonas rubra]KAF7788853.1 hypothetical protein PRUB_a1939 [Pseudoalteromonas rubra]KAF7788854.1 hypothetical protein PRUB_a1940 [Pseudoalteromonas rubra]
MSPTPGVALMQVKSPLTGTTFYNPDRLGRGFFMPVFQYIIF